MTRTPFPAWPHSLSVRPLAWLALLLAALLAACGGSNDPVPVGLDAQPASVSVTAGASVTFAVAASGDVVAYQWQRSVDAAATWHDVAGATAASYAISAVDASLDGQQFRVVVTGAANAVTSSAATLTVAPQSPPAILVQPADQSVLAGANASFSVTATGTALTYRWQSSADSSTWTDIAGANDVAVTLTAVTLADSGRQVRVVVANAAGSVTSRAALLGVAADVGHAPTIVAQPSDASVIAPQTATFTVTATGSPAPTYQWQVSSDHGATFADIPSATGASYTTAATVAGDSDKRFRVHVVNPLGEAFSRAAVLTLAVAQAPVITQQPVDQTVTAPATATFTVAATGTPTPTYQWQVSIDSGATFANINGATSTTYTTPATTTTDNGKRFRAVASNSGGSTTSSAAIPSVVAPAPPPAGDRSSQCAPWILPAGTTVRTVYDNATLPQQAGTSVTSNHGVVPFAGHDDAVEIETTQNLAAALLDAKTYGSFDYSSGAVTGYGSISRISVTAGASTTAQDTTSVLTPPFVDTEFSLSPGQSVTAQTETTIETTVITVNGVAGAQTTTTRTSSSPATTLVGFETVTVPAGTFKTCRYLSSTGVTSWLLYGYGTGVKTSQGSFATSIQVNGVALTSVP